MEAHLSPAAYQPAVTDLTEDYLAAAAARNLSINSIRLYRRALDRYTEFSPGDPASVTPRILRHFIFALQSDGLSSATVHHYFRAVKAFFRFLVSEGIIDTSPAAAMTMPKIGKRLPRVLSEAQSQALLDACPDWTWTGRRDKTAIFLLLGSGLRLSELLSLDLPDVDMDDGFVRVIGKGDKQRSVPLEESVLAALEDWIGLRAKVLAGRPLNALFVSRHGGRMGKTFGQSVKRIGKQAGFYCTPHVLRHTMATDWIRSGGDSMTLKDILGHSNISVTEIYVNLAQRDFKEAVNRHSITKRLRFDGRQLQLLKGA